MRILIALLCLLLSGGWVHAEEDTVEYLPLESLVVNLEGRRHYLRTDAQLLLESAENADKIKAHLPAIRHALIMTLSNRPSDQLAVPEEREKLRLAALQAIRTMLDKYSADRGLKDLFFTEFLVQ